MSLVRLGRLRTGVYRFLATGFSYPTGELMDVAAGARQVLDPLGLYEYAFAPPIADAAETLAASRLADLEAAYAALFEAGVGGAACSPHATAYVADARTGEVARARTALRADYRRFGLGDDLCGADSTDHVATELEVMARLCDDEVCRRAELAEPGLAVGRQHEFLAGSLLPWIVPFARLVRDADRHGGYSALAAALHAFVEHERELVRALLAPVGSDR